MEIIKAAAKQAKVNKSALAKQFNLKSESTIRDILKDKATILKAVEEGGSAKRARLKQGMYAEMEEALVIWIKQVRSLNIPVSGELVKVSFCFHFCLSHEPLGKSQVHRSAAQHRQLRSKPRLVGQLQATLRDPLQDESRRSWCDQRRFSSSVAERSASSRIAQVQAGGYL